MRGQSEPLGVCVSNGAFKAALDSDSAGVQGDRPGQLAELPALNGLQPFIPKTAEIILMPILLIF